MSHLAPFDPAAGTLAERIALSESPGFKVIQKFGAALSVGTTPTIVSTSKTYQTPTTAAALEILSSSGDDAVGGTGGQSVEVIGLGPGYVEQTKTVNLAGLTAVAVPGTWLRVYRMRLVSTGTYATTAASSHVGEITLQGAGAGVVWAKIDVEAGIGLGQTQIGAYTVPAGRKAWLGTRYGTIETSKNITLLFFERQNADDVTAPYTGCMRVQAVDRGLTGTFTSDGAFLRGPYTGPCDLGFFAEAAATTTSNVSITFEILEINADDE